MDKKELRILQVAQGCEDTLKKRGIAVIAIIVLGIVSGMFKGAGIIGGLEVVALFSLIITPICAVPYRIVSIAIGRKVYLEDSDTLTSFAVALAATFSRIIYSTDDPAPPLRLKASANLMG